MGSIDLRIISIYARAAALHATGAVVLVCVVPTIRP
jgi:hypothetical protein